MLDARSRYDPRPGCPSNELSNFRDSTKGMLLLYGDLPADEIGPVQLRAVQLWMGDQDLCLSTIHGRVKRLRRIWRWAVSHTLLEPERLLAIQSVEPARLGRASEPVQPVSTEAFEAVLPLLGPVIGIMSKLQLLTGARPAEVCMMRGSDIDRTGEVWKYTPSRHKNQWRGQTREIFLGPKSILLIQPRLRPGPLFLTTHGTVYSTQSYGQAVRRACDRAGVKRWSPNMLRHTAASRIRDQLGIEVAQAVLGHATMRSTEIYAERSERHAIEAAQRFG